MRIIYPRFRNRRVERKANRFVKDATVNGTAAPRQRDLEGTYVPTRTPARNWRATPFISNFGHAADRTQLNAAEVESV